jgi:ABC-type phosphate transport system substrate-binding protein
MHYFSCIAWALFAAAVGTHAHAADVVVVMSTKSPELNLSKDQVADIFLGKAVYFPDGRRAVPIDQSEGLAVRNTFYDAFTGRSAAQIKAHWAKVIFTGRGRPPKQVANGEEAKRQLAQDPNAIAYLEAALVDSSVRIVSPE